MAAAIGVAFNVWSSIPLWSLPVFAVLATIGAVLLGARLPQVLITFVVIVAIFPLGLLYVIGRAGRLSSTQTLSLLATEPGAYAWVLMLSPVVVATVTCMVATRLIPAR
jgi:hypothetical protein